MSDATTSSQEKNLKSRSVWDIAWNLSEILLFLGIALYAVQPLVVLFGRITRLPFTVYGVFFTSSVISAIAVVVRCALFLFLKASPSAITKSSVKDFFASKWEIFVLLFAFVWTFISCLVAINQRIVWSGNNYNIEGFWAVAKYGAIFLSAYLIKNSKLKTAFCRMLVWSATIMGLILLYTNLSGTSFAYHFTRSVYRNSNHYGYALSVSTVMAVGFAVKEKKIYLKALYIICFGVLHANMLVSDCLGSLIGEIFGLIALFIAYFMREKRLDILYVLIAVVVVFGAVTFALEHKKVTNVVQDAGGVVEDTQDIVQGESDGEEGSGRWELWTGTLEVIKKAPFFGKGLDCYYGNNHLDTSLDMPHNEYLQIASNVGIPVLIAYLVAFGGVYVRAIVRRKDLTDISIICLASAFGYLVSAFFGNTFTYTYPFLLILLALGMFKTRRK